MQSSNFVESQITEVVINTNETLEINTLEKRRQLSNSILYMDILFDPANTVATSVAPIRGLNMQFKRALSLRFEMQRYYAFRRMPLKELTQFERHFFKKLLNFMLPNKFDIDEMIRLNILRKFVIRSYQGLCHAQGKPIHGQRT